MLAGGFGGIAGWTSTYPIDVVKTVIQADSRLTSGPCKAMPMWQCLKDHYTGVHGYGTTSLFRGFWATVLRAFPTNVAILSTWHITMDWFRKSGFLMESGGADAV